jgi:transposase
MTTRHRSKRRLRTIWRIPDDLWAQLEPLLPPEKPPGTPGGPVVPFRQVMDGILYVLRTGCQWKALPREYGSGSRRWVVERTGAWHNRFRKLLIRYEKRMENYRGLVHFACSLIVYRLTVLAGISGFHLWRPCGRSWGG